MSVDIELPNGSILEDVPDDIAGNKHQVAMKAIEMGMATNADFGYESGAGELGAAGGGGELFGGAIETGGKVDRLMSGIGRGFVNTGRQVGNMLNLVSDEEMADAEALDRDLMNTGMGITGDIIGSVAATAPIGGAVGGLAKAGKAAQGAGVAARAGRAGGRVLGSPMGRGGVEGAAYGSLYGGPDNRGAGAMWGAGLGLGMGGLIQGLGSVWKNAKVGTLKEADEVAEELGSFIPISQAGKEGGLPRMIYNAVLSNLPGSAGKIRGQYKDVTAALRRWAGTKAHPDDAHAAIRITDDDSIHQVFQKLDDYWKGDKTKGIPGAYDEVGRTVIDASKVHVNKTTRDLIAAEGKRLNVPYRIPQGIQSKTQNMLNFRNAVSELKMKTEPGQFTKKIHSSLDDTLDKIDNQLEKQLSPEMWSHYTNLGPSYRNYQTLKSAVDKAKSLGQEFTPPQLLVAAAEKAGASARSGGGSYQQLANNATKALQDFPSKAGVYQMVASIGLSSGLLGVFVGTAMPLLTVAGIYGVAKAVGTKKFQQFLMGGFRGKAALEHPEMKKLFRLLGYTARQQAAMQTAEDL